MKNDFASRKFIITIIGIAGSVLSSAMGWVDAISALAIIVPVYIGGNAAVHYADSRKGKYPEDENGN
jgi:hypothetical protein